MIPNNFPNSSYDSLDQNSRLPIEKRLDFHASNSNSCLNIRWAFPSPHARHTRKLPKIIPSCMILENPELPNLPLIVFLAPPSPATSTHRMKSQILAPQWISPRVFRWKFLQRIAPSPPLETLTGSKPLN
ncbi:hypothetical protein U1Q18_010798 [Sarracenia purpurea var. burkii]